MAFINLDRHFAPLAKEQEVALELSIGLGRKFGGWMGWGDLTSHRRVVILAEALSGKTTELEHQVVALQSAGKAAFFLRVEDLADGVAFASGDLEQEAAFRGWRDESEEKGWFLLDSVDEARLQGKRFEKALTALKNEIKPVNLQRAFIVVTCRASDWRGTSDRERLEQILAIPRANADAPSTRQLSPAERDALLLESVVPPTQCPSKSEEKRESSEASENLLVVQLLPLTDEQKLLLARANGIDGAGFLRAVEQGGLDAFSERPGDILDLLSYWREHNRFESLTKMMEASISRKLREIDPQRGSRNELSPQRALEGAQWIAAALTLTKSFTIKAPRQESDPTLSAGALDAADILHEWAPVDVDALLRTGLFAPSTYGRIRFHHRASQEFLAARWFHSLLTGSWPISEAMQLFFAEPYGVKTVVPALLPVVAWLAQWFPQICAELVAREPASLIIHGDAKSLPLAVKNDLLAAYARLNAAGDLDSETFDSRATWAFSDPRLSDSIRNAWRVNERSRFRLTMLQFILEGRVDNCADLARDVVLDHQAGYSRIVATEILLNCNDDGLQHLVGLIRTEPESFGCRIAPRIAVLLYPQHLTTSELFTLVEATPSGQRHSTDGFSHHLLELYEAASSREMQLIFIEHLLGLVRAPVKALEEPGLSQTPHIDLVRGMAGIALAEVERAGADELSPLALELVMTVERSRESAHDSEALNELGRKVTGSWRLNRQLMWADYQEALADESRSILYFWQIGPFTGRILWDVHTVDAKWVGEDAESSPDEGRRIVAFSALLRLSSLDSPPPEINSLLERLAGTEPKAAEMLHKFRNPPPKERWQKVEQLRQRNFEAQRREYAQWWLQYRDDLVENPSVLDAPNRVNTWEDGLNHLYQLHRWVESYCRRAKVSAVEGLKQTSFVFSRDVTEHYIHAMTMCWRNVPPARPAITGPSHSTRLRVNELAAVGLELESLTNASWPEYLSSAEVLHAARHAVCEESVSGVSFKLLLQRYPDIVAPLILEGLTEEFASGAFFSSILDEAGHTDSPLRIVVAAEIFRRVEAHEPTNYQLFTKCLDVLRLSNKLLPPNAVKAMCERRANEHVASGDDRRAFRYLEVLGQHDAELVAEIIARQLELLEKLDRQADKQDKEARQRADVWVIAAFNAHFTAGFANRLLKKLSVARLLELLKLAYRFVGVEPDEGDEDEEVSVHDVRTHRNADWARGTLLNELVTRPGHEAYAAVLELTKHLPKSFDSLNFREAAHRKARRDADLTAWNGREVFSFGKLHTAPVKSGFDLYRLINGVLEDIVLDLDRADVSTRKLLVRADREEDVQQWLVERLNAKSRGRYNCFREPEVADHNAPDVVVTSTSAAVEVAIEVKNANMGWSVPDLEVALLEQLAEDYLLPGNRRHGVLLISLHKPRTWNPSKGVEWSFDEVIRHLQERAKSLQANKAGSIEVSVVALNAHREEAGNKVVTRKSNAARKTSGNATAKISQSD